VVEEVAAVSADLTRASDDATRKAMSSSMRWRKGVVSLVPRLSKQTAIVAGCGAFPDPHRPAGNAAAATRQSSNPARSAAFADASHHEAVDLAVSPVEFAVDLADLAVDLTVCLARLSVDDIIDGGEIATRA
jgi:hypothetical protein